MNLKEIFDEVSDQMKSDFTKAQKSLSHAGLKGTANEKTVREFLRQYLPKTLDVTTGMIVDSEGNQSRQLDIIICDSSKTPIFFQSGETRVIPIECTYAVVEVKAFLDKPELEKSFNNMLSVKTLTKKAYFKQKSDITRTHTLFGKEWDHWPIQYLVAGGLQKCATSGIMKSVVISLMVGSPPPGQLGPGLPPPRLGLFYAVSGGFLVQLAVRKAVDK